MGIPLEGVDPPASDLQVTERELNIKAVRLVQAEPRPSYPALGHEVAFRFDLLRRQDSYLKYVCFRL